MDTEDIVRICGTTLATPRQVQAAVNAGYSDLDIILEAMGTLDGHPFLLGSAQLAWEDWQRQHPIRTWLAGLWWTKNHGRTA